MQLPSVTIVIPARNEESTIAKCLKSLSALEYPKSKLELILFDDASADKTLDLMKKTKTGIATRIIAGKGQGPSKARNEAARVAKGELVAFTDADCIVDAKWIQKLASVFRGKDVSGAGGIQLVPKDETAFGKRVFKFLEKVGVLGEYVKRDSAILPADHNPTCNSIYRKSVLLGAGGFDEKLWPGEDVELDRRLVLSGKKLLFVPGAVVFHYRQQNLAQFSKMMHKYGWAQGFLVKKFGAFRRIHAAALAFSLLLALGVLAFAFAPLQAALFAAGSAMLCAGFLWVAKVDLELFAFGAFEWHFGFLKGFLLGVRPK